MKDADLIRELKRIKVQTGGLICLGCGHEHNCGVHGCAVIREAAQRLEEYHQGKEHIDREALHGSWEGTAEEIAMELCDDFTDFVTGGVHNAAPYCANFRPECVNNRGWCNGDNKVCRGFLPKAARIKKEE